MVLGAWEILERADLEREERDMRLQELENVLSDKEKELVRLQEQEEKKDVRDEL